MSFPSDTSREVLVLGSGLVCPPLVDYLSSHKYGITLASRTKAKADALIAGLPKAQQSYVRAVEYDVEADSDLSKLRALVVPSHLVVSLLPYIYHVKAAELSLAEKKPFFTTSYVSPPMAALDTAVKAAGLCFMNECGVDPGLDHMSAQHFIHTTHARGGKILSFHSLCGGLPAPAANNNPLAYKLSWSPRGVLLASRNTATYLESGHTKILPGASLYEPDVGYHIEQVQSALVGKLDLEWYPNRDSTVYKDIYGITQAQTIIRGTYRNAGWCRMMKFLSEHGFTSTDEAEAESLWRNAKRNGPTSLAQFTYSLLNKSSAPLTPTVDVRQFAATVMGVSMDDDVLVRMDFLGLFDHHKMLPGHNKVPTALDVLCYLFEQHLQYAAGEQDMIVMKHTFVVEVGGATETWTSTLIDVGQQDRGGYSSMARTVSLPVAIAIRAYLEGRLAGVTGVVRPIQPETYKLILEEMETLGVKFVEEKVA